MLKKTIPVLISMVLMNFYSLNALAAGCDEKSPTYIEQGDKYFDIEEVGGLTNKQKKQIRKIFSSVKSRLKGSGNTGVCFVGDDGAQKKQLESEKYKAEFSVFSDGAITLSIDAEKLKQRVTYSDTFKFFDGNSLFIIKKITDKSVEAVSKYRVSRPIGGGSILREEFVTLTVHGKGFKVESTIYINGYYSNEYSRDFK